jgi:hypothetical protein
VPADDGRRELKAFGRSPGFRSTLRWTVGTGHVPMNDDPELVARTVLEFTHPT